jgi:putative heme iron utilization protein
VVELVHQQQVVAELVHQPQAAVEALAHQPQAAVGALAHQPQAVVEALAHQPQAVVEALAHQPQAAVLNYLVEEVVMLLSLRLNHLETTLVRLDYLINHFQIMQQPQLPSW